MTKKEVSEFDSKDDINKSKHNHKYTSNKSTKSVNDGSVYRVVPLPTPSPNHGPFESLTEPADPDASPFGWHDTDGVEGPEYTITRGNNVYAKEDDEGDGSLSGTDYSPDGGSDLNFDFQADLDQQPADYMDASLTCLLYTSPSPRD